MPNRQIYVEGEGREARRLPASAGHDGGAGAGAGCGVTVRFSPDKTVLIRRDVCGQAQGSKVDLASAIKKPGSSERRGPDVARRSLGAAQRSRDFDLWMKQHVRDALPVEPICRQRFRPDQFICDGKYYVTEQLPRLDDIAWRRRRIAMMAGGLVFGVVALGTLLWPPLYSSNCHVLVQDNRAQ